MEAAIDGSTIISGVVVLLLAVLGVLLKMWMNTITEAQKENHEQQKEDKREVLNQLTSNFREFTKANEHSLELIQDNKTEILLVKQSHVTHVDYTETRFDSGMNKIAANTEAITRIKKG